MNRPARAVLVLAISFLGAVHGHTQSPAAPSAQSELEEAERLHQQVETLYAEGKYQEAVGPAERALAIREKALEPTHLDIAEILNDLAAIYDSLGVSARAEPLYLRALAIREKALGPMHPDVANSLNNLAALYDSQGIYAKAEPLYLRALAIREKAMGATDPLIAASLNNLATLYWKQGTYARAEPLYLRSLAIREKALGPTHPLVASSLDNLATLYWEQGAYARAEPLRLRALALREKALGPTHPQVASSLSNLAMLYQAQHAYAKAEPLHLRALAIREEALGPMHPQVAESLNNLAMLYQEQGVYTQAEPLELRALDIRERALGPMHPLVAESLNNLAGLYLDRGAYAPAEPLFARALGIWENVLGPVSPHTVTGLNNLARLSWAQGAHARAQTLLARAADLREHQLRSEIVRLSEPRTRALMALVQRDTDSVISLHADAMADSAPALELALTTVLRRKGRILDSLVDSDARLRAQLTPELRKQLDQLSQARSELVTRLYAPDGARRAKDRAAVAAVRARIDELEMKLSAASAAFRAQMAPFTVAQIQAALPPRTALVEFVRYRRFAPREPQPLREAHYLAYVVTARDTPRWIPLGEAAPIDAQIDTVLAALHDAAARDVPQAALHRLDTLALAPIRPLLSGISHLVLAPDGKLNLVPFEALLDPQGRYALENYLTSYVTTGRDLVRLAAPQAPRSPAVIMAAPEYGAMPPPRQPGTLSFSELPDALAEAMDLRTYFPAAPLTGKSATKSALAALAGPAMLHVVTHGFYARAPETSPAPSSAPVVPPGASRGMFMSDSGSLPPPTSADDLADALDRSGLAMAGANQGASGIVTAREIAGFDLRGTQLVVLSACDTGAGAASFGDGVYGMRRALVLAGAASQVVSLWGVNDAATRTLMRDYYGLLARGIGRAEALRQAKLMMLHRPGYQHPYYWAAFIPAGDWRPLDKRAIRSSSQR